MLLVILIFVIIFLLFLYVIINKKSVSIDIEKCYPPIGVNFLKKYEGNKEIDKWFDVESVVNPLPYIKDAISCSLFCKNVNNRYENEGECPDMSEDGKWYKKYMEKFIDILDNFESTGFYKNNWKIRLYLAKDISNKYLDMFVKYKYLEIYIMKSSSIGAQPGMLWRFLPYGDTSLDMVGVIDIDITVKEFNDFYKSVKLFDKYPYYMMLKTVYGYPSEISENEDEADSKSESGTKPINHTLILGGMYLLRPKLLGLNNIKNIMSAFMNYRMKSSNNLYGDNDSENICNKPIRRHIYGWGNHWFMYGFDERFLKHFMR